MVGGLCTHRTPAHLKDQLRYEYEIEKQNVIIYEIRPAFMQEGEFTKNADGQIKIRQQPESIETVLETGNREVGKL